MKYVPLVGVNYVNQISYLIMVAIPQGVIAGVYIIGAKWAVSQNHLSHMKKCQ